MKILAIFAIITLAAACSTPRSATPSKGVGARAPASVDTKRLLEIDERRGCCSHHGGVSHCSYGTLYCQDGWASGCGC